MSKLLSVEEAAEILGVSRHTLNQWKSMRRIRFVKFGRRTLFDPADLDELIEKCKVEPNKAN